ncbi:MAG: hypothetical protein SGBAC_009227 [Bacillariaceae sp.]
MQRTSSSESFSSVEKDSGNPPRRAGRRVSIENSVWQKKAREMDSSSSSHDKAKPKQRPQHVFGDFVTPGARTGGKPKLNVTAPMSANPRLSTAFSPKAPPGQSRRTRTSAKLKVLWPPLDPLHATQEIESSKAASISPVPRRISSPVARHISSPFQSPATRKTPKRISESVVHDLGTTLLSATGKRRTLKGVWPPPNLKQETDKKPSKDTLRSGITQNRKSVFNRSSTHGSADGDTEKTNQYLSPKKPRSAQTLVSVSTTTSSNEDWASESAKSTPTQQPSSASSKKIDPDNMSLMSLVLASESSEHEADSSHHSGISSVKGNESSVRSYRHSWEVWTTQGNKHDFAGDSPLDSPVDENLSLGTKTDVDALPRAPDLASSPHAIHGISGSTPNTAAFDRQNLQLPIGSMASAATAITTEIVGMAREDSVPSTPKNTTTTKPKTPMEFSQEATVKVARKDDDLMAPKPQTEPALSIPEVAATPVKEEVPPAKKTPLAIPLMRSPEEDTNLQSSDDDSVWSSDDDGAIIDARSVENKDEETSTNASPTSPTTDSQGSLSSTESYEEELNFGPPRFVMPEKKPLAPKTRVVGKRQKTEYRIRWDGPTTLDLGVYYPLISIPEVEDLPENDDRFERSQADRGLAMPMRSGRSIDGDTMSLDSLFSADESIDSDDKSEKSEKSQSSSQSRPSIHMRPVEDNEEEKDDSKWKLKRVWNLEEMDEQEKEHTVQRAEVMPSVKELCGVPANINLKDMGSGTPWVIQKVNFIDDEEIDPGDEVAFTADDMMKEMEIITSKIDLNRDDDILPPTGDPNKSKEKAEEQAGKTEANPAKRKPKRKKKKMANMGAMDSTMGITTVVATTEEEVDSSSRETLEPLPRLTLSNGQKLPPTRRKKGRRTNYQLRYDGPSMLQVSELFVIPEHDDRFNEPKVDKSMLPTPVRRGSNPKSAFDEMEENDAIPEKPSRSKSNDDLDIMEESIIGEDGLEGFDHGDTNDARIGKRPQLLMTLTKEQKQSMKWLVRRVWDDEDFDEKEYDHSVADKELTSKVRELFGVPSDIDLESLKSESRFNDVSSIADSAPFLLRRIYDFDGEIEEVEAGVEFGEKDLEKAIDHVNAEAKETVMWWEVTPDSEPKFKPLSKGIVKKLEEPWYTYNVKNEAKPKKRIMPWHKIATPKKEVKEREVKMWWEE